MSTRAYSQLYYHFAWSTRDWEPLIDPTWEHRLYSYIMNSCARRGFLHLASGGTNTHTRCLVRLPPEVAPSDFTSAIKGASSHFVNASGLCDVKFRWQEGYGVFSVSPRAVRDVAAYIRNQRKRHGTAETIDAWELTENTTPNQESPIHEENR